MLSCNEAERLIARQVDGVLSPDDRLQLDAHLDACAECRAARTAQAEVAALLRTRGAESPVDLSAKIAARIDDEASIMGLANWRAWTLGLVPVAAALMLAAYLGIGASSATATTDDSSAQSAASNSVLMQPGTSGDILVEAVLTGTAAGTVESDDVR